MRTYHLGNHVTVGRSKHLRWQPVARSETRTKPTPTGPRDLLLRVGQVGPLIFCWSRWLA